MELGAIVSTTTDLDGTFVGDRCGRTEDGGDGLPGGPGLKCTAIVGSEDGEGDKFLEGVLESTAIVGSEEGAADNLLEGALVLTSADLELAIVGDQLESLEGESEG